MTSKRGGSVQGTFTRGPAVSGGSRGARPGQFAKPACCYHPEAALSFSMPRALVLASTAEGLQRLSQQCPVVHPGPSVSVDRALLLGDMQGPQASTTLMRDRRAADNIRGICVWPGGATQPREATPSQATDTVQDQSTDTDSWTEPGTTAPVGRSFRERETAGRLQTHARPACWGAPG